VFCGDSVQSLNHEVGTPQTAILVRKDFLRTTRLFDRREEGNLSLTGDDAILLSDLEKVDPTDKFAHAAAVDSYRLHSAIVERMSAPVCS